FFQAEDGIRDRNVTGVQTCALPICAHRRGARGRAVTGILVAALVLGVPALAFVLWPLVGARGRSQALLPLPPDRRGELEERKGRSEERRVGKECGGGGAGREDERSG